MLRAARLPLILRRRKTVRFWLACVAAACFLPAVLAVALLLGRAYELARANIERASVGTARALVLAVDRELASVEAVAQVMAQTPELARNDIAAFYDFAQKVQLSSSGVRNFVLSDESGQQVANTLRPLGEALPPHGNQAGLRRVFDTGAPVLSDLFLGAVARHPVLSIDVPVRQNGRVVYDLSIGFLPDRLGRVLTELHLPEGWVASLFDSSHTIVARTRELDQFFGRPGSAPLVLRMAEVAEGSFDADRLDGIPAVASFSRSPVSGWAVAVEIPVSVQTAVLRRNLLLDGSGAVVLLLLSALMARAVSLRIGRAIYALTTPAIALGSGQPVAIPTTDITEVDDVGQALGKAAELIDERTARLRSILETAPDAIITIDEQCIIQSFSDAAKEMFGYAAGEVIGQNVKILMPAPYRESHDGYVARYLATGERHIIGIRRRVEARRKDGAIFPIDLAVGEVNLGETRIFTAFIRDLTMRVRMEEDLRQAQKMEAIGQLTGGVAHDFNNLLTVISGNLEMLERRLTSAGEREILTQAQEACQLGAELSDRLLAFGRRQPLHPKPIDVNALVSGMVELLRRSLGEVVTIETRLADGLPTIMADPGQVENALLNLAINARDAMPKGGRLLIETAWGEIDKDHAAAHPEVAPGRYVILAVTDTGTGMSLEVRQRAFEPFFTTKGPGAGTGLGLSMVYGFVKQSGGHVELDSELGLGTTVRLYLPARNEDARTGEPRAAAAAVRAASGETVLVVEDDEPVRRVSIRRLKELGYAVIEADSGPAALKVLDTGKPIDLLFTDIVMSGGMTGVDLAREARRRRPELKILLTSGYAAPAVINDGASTTNAGWLAKPYSIGDLDAKLRELLDR